MTVVLRPSNRWLKMGQLYRRFASEWPHFDFSPQAALEMFKAETHGGSVSPNNGYALGKKWMNVTIAMWREDIPKGLLFVKELRADGYPDWFLKRVGVL